MTVEFPPDYRVVTVAEAEERLAVSGDVWCPYAEFIDEQEIRLSTLPTSGRSRRRCSAAAATRWPGTSWNGARTLSTVDHALTVAERGEHDYILDQVLARDPYFGDFADLRESPELLRWRSAEGGVP